MIDYNVDTIDEKVARNKLYAYIVIHRNKKQNNARKEISHEHLIQNDNIRLNLYSSNDDEDMWSNHKPSNM